VSVQPHRRESPIKSACRPVRFLPVDKSNAGQTSHRGVDANTKAMAYLLVGMPFA
jgi:hypothetical protein